LPQSSEIFEFDPADHQIMTRKLLVLASLSLCCAGCLPERSTLPPGGVPARGLEGEMRVLTEPEKKLVRESVLTAVPNPAFAQFRWTKLPKVVGEAEYYCAQVNAQAAGGQWVGFRPFVVLLETGKSEVRYSRLVELAPDRLEITSVVSKCRENGLDAFATVESDGASVIGAVGR
jgi:hypothetical protein